MKRFLLPAAMAFGLHGLVLAIDPHWMAHEPPVWKPPVPVSVTLSYIEPEKPQKPEIAKAIPTPAAVKPKPVNRPMPLPVKHIRPIEKKKSPPPVRLTAEPEPSLKPVSNIPQDTDVNPKTPEDIETTNAIAALTPAPARIATPEPVVIEARPLYKENPPPRYPRIARKRGYQGTVVLEVLVDRSGDVEDLKIYQSSGYKALDKAALSSVRRWIFSPGRRGDDVVDMWVRVPIAFRLTE